MLYEMLKAAGVNVDPDYHDIILQNKKPFGIPNITIPNPGNNYKPNFSFMSRLGGPTHSFYRPPRKTLSEEVELTLQEQQDKLNQK
jgi:hypothetical protein